MQNEWGLKLQTKEESEVRVMCALKIVGTPVFRETALSCVNCQSNEH